MNASGAPPAFVPRCADTLAAAVAEGLADIRVPCEMRSGRSTSSLGAFAAPRVHGPGATRPAVPAFQRSPRRSPVHADIKPTSNQDTGSAPSSSTSTASCSTRSRPGTAGAAPWWPSTGCPGPRRPRPPMMGMSAPEWSAYVRDDARRAARAAADLRPGRRPRAARATTEGLPLLPGAEAAVARHRGALADRARLVLQPRGDRPRDGDLRLGRRVFQTWVSSEEVARGKPAPDVFLEALRRLGVEARARGGRRSRTRTTASSPPARPGSASSPCPTPSSRPAPRRSRPPTSCSADSTSSRPPSWPADPRPPGRPAAPSWPADPRPAGRAPAFPPRRSRGQRRGGSTRTNLPRFNIDAIVHARSICACVYRVGLWSVSM